MNEHKTPEERVAELLLRPRGPELSLHLHRTLARILVEFIDHVQSENICSSDLRNSTMTYGQVSRLAMARGADIHYRIAGYYVGNLSQACQVLDFPVISAIVVSQADRTPGNGFRPLVRNPDSDTTDQEYRERQETARDSVLAYEHWSQFIEFLDNLTY